MAKRKIPQTVKKKIKKFKDNIESDGIKINSIYLYGSYARGNNNKWSDIDICVISPSFGKKIKKPLDYLWSKRLLLDDFSIEPIGFSPKEFKEGGPVISEVIKYGIKV